MQNNVTKIAESYFRQFQLTNNNQHNAWKDFLSNLAPMDADLRFKEVAATKKIMM